MKFSFLVFAGFCFGTNSDFDKKIVANKFYILVKTGNTIDSTTSDWKEIDFTSEAGGSSLSGLTGTTFIIDQTKYTTGSTFNLGKIGRAHV